MASLNTDMLSIPNTVGVQNCEKHLDKQIYFQCISTVRGVQVEYRNLQLKLGLKMLRAWTLVWLEFFRSSSWPSHEDHVYRLCCDQNFSPFYILQNHAGLHCQWISWAPPPSPAPGPASSGLVLVLPRQAPLDSLLMNSSFHCFIVSLRSAAEAGMEVHNERYGDNKYEWLMELLRIKSI